MADKKKNALSPDAAKILLLLLIPVIGIGGTASVSIIKGFTLREILLNTAISAALCIVAEIPLKYATFEEEGSGWIVLGYLSGLAMSLLSALGLEFLFPLAAPAVMIAFLSEPFNGAAALILFTGDQFSSVAQLCPTLCDPMDCSMPGFPVYHQFLGLTQIHVL